MKNLSLKDRTKTRDWLWFDIESASGQQGEGDERHDSTLEESRMVQKWSKNSVQDSSVIAVATNEARGINNSSDIEQIDQGLAVCQNLCLKLDTGTYTDRKGFQSFTLEHISGRKLSVHLPVSKRISGPPVSLAELIAQVPTVKASDGIPQYQKLFYAKVLSLAILQFHTTPWLSGSWNSDKIFLSGSSKEDSEEQPSPSTPYLKAIVSPTKSSASRSNTTFDAGREYHSQPTSL